MENNLKEFEIYKEFCKRHYLKPGTPEALEIYFIYKRSGFIPIIK